MRDNHDNHDNRHNRDNHHNNGNDAIASGIGFWRANEARAVAGIEAHNHPAQRCFPCAVNALAPWL